MHLALGSKSFSSPCKIPSALFVCYSPAFGCGRMLGTGRASGSALLVLMFQTNMALSFNLKPPLWITTFFFFFLTWHSNVPQLIAKNTRAEGTKVEPAVTKPACTNSLETTVHVTSKDIHLLLSPLEHWKGVILKVTTLQPFLSSFENRRELRIRKRFFLCCCLFFSLKLDIFILFFEGGREKNNFYKFRNKEAKVLWWFFFFFWGGRGGGVDDLEFLHSPCMAHFTALCYCFSSM